MTGQSMTGKDNVLGQILMDLELNFIRGGTGNHLILGSGSSGYGYEVINALSEKKMLRGRRSRLQQKYKAEGVTINSGEFSASALINIVYL